MNVIQRICSKYTIEYNMMPDFRMRPVNLRFGSGVPYDLQDRILEGLDLMCVYLEDGGMPMSLELSADIPECYTLFQGTQPLFHFPVHPNGIHFVNYDVTQALCWTMYILASRKDWLEPYQGKFLSCRCFSARQQAAAMHISGSVNQQYQTNVPQEQIRKVFDKLRSSVGGFAQAAPLFSAQPMEETAFDRCKGRTLDTTVGELARGLFGNKSFYEELERYCQTVQDREEYRTRLEQACDFLEETAYSLPILSVNRLFTELGALTDEIAIPGPAECAQLLRESVRFSLSADSLRLCFEKADRAYREAVTARLETDFLRNVCERSRSRIHQAFTSAKRGIMQLRNELSRFCFVRESSFEEGGRSLSWKQLACLEERDIYSKDVSWTPGSLNDLQSVIKSTYAPQLWICSELLRNQSEMAAITDLHLTKAGPLMDNHLVWAMWVDVKAEGGW